MADKSSSIKISAVKKISGEINLPGDKSISHRAVMLGSIADGVSEISNVSSGRDCLATINCIRNLGINIKRQSVNTVNMVIYGKTTNGNYIHFLIQRIEAAIG